jgi:hypothetical protein
MLNTCMRIKLITHTCTRLILRWLFLPPPPPPLAVALPLLRLRSQRGTLMTHPKVTQTILILHKRPRGFSTTSSAVAHFPQAPANEKVAGGDEARVVDRAY